ncbi:MAG: hypothetical protein M1816_000604 [Peltula sp. TS41687]|nr:MAG: hypothetical protein M1816_000604 [Peltula sp. TS41687]
MLKPESQSNSPDEGDHPSPHTMESNETKETVLSSTTLAPETTNGDPMDTGASVSAAMGPPTLSSPDVEQIGGVMGGVAGAVDPMNPGHPGPGAALGAAAAAAAAAQPKVVQTAFIHKLYNMLEDPNIQHLISWSTSNESFVMSPSSEFAKVLSQYFKHTNVSSFVRQLNMYGFHKVSDVFHTGSPETMLWEFKHGNGNFKRGDLMGLREIKRRASRHALINRETFPANHKVHPSQPGVSVEPMLDSTECRIASLEHNLYDVHSRLARTEENYASLHQRYHSSSEALLRCHQFTHDLSNMLVEIIPDPSNPIRRDISIMQKELGRQMDILRTPEDPSEMYLAIRPHRIPNVSPDGGSFSPRQTARDDLRRPTQLSVPQPNFFRPPIPAHATMSPRRYGSVGNGTYSPGSLRPQQAPPPPPPPQYSLASNTSPAANLGRRHTSADIRLHGWQGQTGSPYASGNSSVQWPSSPKRTSNAGDHSLHVREVLARYEIQQPPQSHGSRQTTPPLTNDTPSTTSADSSWSMAGSRFLQKAADPPGGPFSRRSSLASNVHSLLNPSDTVERNDEDEFIIDDRKRKRLQ